MNRCSMTRNLIIISLIAAALIVSVFLNTCQPKTPVSSDGKNPSISSQTDDSEFESSSDIVTMTDVSIQPETTEPIPDSVTIQMGGDIFIHDTVRKAAATGKNTYDFTSYFSLFEDVFVSDLNIINLESPVDAKGGNNGVSGYPDFNMPIEMLDVLKNINIDLCITANNHSVDKGYSGLCRSLENVNYAGFDTVGTYASQKDADTPYITEINGIKIGVAAFTTRTNGKVWSEAPYCVSICGTKYDKMCETILPKIKALKDGGAEFIIIAMHWGGEYADAPSDVQKELAKTMCEAGADIIMGSHSHCVQPIEVLNVDRGGVPSQALVIYSLGNLFANQTALNMNKTQEGMIVSAKAVRGEDGIVRLDSSFYMPTFTYVRGISGKDYMRLIPAGRYVMSKEKPSLFEDNGGWKRCKNAWANVQDTAGHAIGAVTDPSAYPSGFFASEPVSGSDLS